ncbi:hypothetical protein TSOC_003686 [Tetrabaena socialis]|uniref:Uncharacterized protein n=1 Tax=Tetrabaena socialis TaxID=47790 RepID=A0A2J8AB05_9CHLO|nr:hypothetical protein TSOC_003686 [Tetrabaena socialis]|eukprot:PNH09704.1 hypothetical protein TSOC_003686 [Tetrabaena socialis]
MAQRHPHGTTRTGTHFALSQPSNASTSSSNDRIPHRPSAAPAASAPHSCGSGAAATSYAAISSAQARRQAAPAPPRTTDPSARSSGAGGACGDGGATADSVDCRGGAAPRSGAVRDSGGGFGGASSTPSAQPMAARAPSGSGRGGGHQRRRTAPPPLEDCRTSSRQHARQQRQRVVTRGGGRGGGCTGRSGGGAIAAPFQAAAGPDLQPQPCHGQRQGKQLGVRDASQQRGAATTAAGVVCDRGGAVYDRGVGWAVQQRGGEASCRSVEGRFTTSAFAFRRASKASFVDGRHHSGGQHSAHRAHSSGGGCHPSRAQAQLATAMSVAVVALHAPGAAAAAAEAMGARGPAAAVPPPPRPTTRPPPSLPRTATGAGGHSAGPPARATAPSAANKGFQGPPETGWDRSGRPINATGTGRIADVADCCGRTSSASQSSAAAAASSCAACCGGCDGNADACGRCACSSSGCAARSGGIDGGAGCELRCWPHPSVGGAATKPLAGASMGVAAASRPLFIGGRGCRRARAQESCARSRKVWASGIRRTTQRVNAASSSRSCASKAAAAAAAALCESSAAAAPASGEEAAGSGGGGASSQGRSRARPQATCTSGTRWRRSSSPAAQAAGSGGGGGGAAAGGRRRHTCASAHRLTLRPRGPRVAVRRSAAPNQAASQDPGTAVSYGMRSGSSRTMPYSSTTSSWPLKSAHRAAQAARMAGTVAGAGG